MNRYKSVENRQQLNMMPLCLDDMVAPDNVVRAIDTIVDNMDIKSMGFTVCASVKGPKADGIACPEIDRYNDHIIVKEKDVSL